MNKTLIHSSIALAAVLSFTLLAYSPARAQSTAFTYQGSLDDGGAPANGAHDFRFLLFSAASGGAQVGATLCSDNVSVVDGVFTAQLDFGQQFATTAQRHLQIEVRLDTGLSCADPTGFVVLAPRQQLTATPIAAHANAAFALDAADGVPANAVYVDNSGNVGIGTTNPQGPLHLNGTLLWGGLTSNYAYSGQDALGLYIEQYGSTTARAKMRLQSSKSGDLVNYSQFFIDPSAGFSFTSGGTANSNVGIGTQSPVAELDVRGDVALGSSGQYRAAGGVENLRLIRGMLAADGTVEAGTGFVAYHVNEGHYRIFFTPVFPEPPSVTVTCGSSYNAPMRDANLLFTRADYVEIKVKETEGGWSDAGFSFCVIGPR